MIGTTKPDQMGTLGVISGDTNGLHHRLGTRHVKTHLVEARDDPQTLDHFKHHWVIRTEHWPQLSDPRDALGNRFFIEVVTKNIDAVGARQVHKALAIQIFKGDPRRALNKTPQLEMATQIRAELKRHPIATGKLHVR